MRINMVINVRLVLISILLGMLTTFTAWAFQWTFESRQEVTFGLPGKVTSLIIVNEGQKTTTRDAIIAQEALKSYLRAHSLTLIYTSIGDGRPEMIVYDPRHYLSWFPISGKQEPWAGKARGYLFRGTYMAERWLDSGRTPLLPKDVIVSGIINAPPGTDNLQYVRTIGRQPLSSGRYTINTTDHAKIEYILSLLNHMGLSDQTEQSVPLMMYFAQNPLIVITVLFLVMGYACAILYWILYLHTQARAFVIRRYYGALRSDLVRETVIRALPSLLAGSLIGMFLSYFLVTIIGQVNWASSYAVMLHAAWSSLFLIMVVWLLTTSGVIKKYEEMNLNE